MDSSQRGGDRNREFSPTQWSLVIAARESQAEASAEALESLCHRYWSPLYAFVRQKGYSPHDAQDLTQEFFVRVLKNNTFAGADPEKGRFRSFLLGCLNHFLLDEWDKARAAKRGGGHKFVPLDYAQLEERYTHAATASGTPEKLFDEQWRFVVLEKALARLREDFTRIGKGPQFHTLKHFITREPTAGEYDALAPTLNMKVNAITVAVHRLRQKFRGAVRAEVAQTVSSPAEVNDEIRALFGF